ncbi:leukocyte receptor cluster member 9 [Aulostomus maculatus]
MDSGCSNVSQTSIEDLRDDVQMDPTGPEAEGPADPQESAEGEVEGVNVCTFFLMGKCRFGHRCRQSHSDPSTDPSGMVPPDQDDKQNEGKMEKHKKKGNLNKAKKPKEKEREGVNKKPRMRTADDVISRILWDPSVDASQFVVGYMDRFLGVVERPFSDFNWDTNPCDCDYSTELALPRHRIQYFTHRGHRIWDRHSRTDRVFGSTGQSLAPPFGGEGEVEEKQPEDQDQQEGLTLEQDRLQTTQEQPPAVSGQEEGQTEIENVQNQSTHLEEEKQNERNIHIRDSAQPKCRGSTAQEPHRECVVEEAANSLKANEFKKEGLSLKEEDRKETQDEGEDSGEGHDSFSSSVSALNLNQNPSSPLGQSAEKRGGRPPKKKPTHFIAFRANTPAILNCFQQLQEEVTTLLPSSAPYWQTSSTLHVTLCLLVLQGPAEVAAAGEILRRFAHLDRNPPVAVAFPVKLKHFNGKVLYLSPQPQLHLQQLNSGLQEAYRKEGWLHRDSYNPRYHLTLAKVKSTEGERIFEGVGDLKLGRGLNFGRLPVNTLHLCSVNGPEVADFYETMCTVTLR